MRNSPYAQHTDPSSSHPTHYLHTPHWCSVISPHAQYITAANASILALYKYIEDKGGGDKLLLRELLTAANASILAL